MKQAHRRLLATPVSIALLLAVAPTATADTDGSTSTRYVQTTAWANGTGAIDRVRSADDAAEYPRLFPLLQAGTGDAQWNNCGPVAAIAAIYAMGRTPVHWDGMNDSAATQYMRYTTMGIPKSQDDHGTSATDLVRGFSAYDLDTTIVSDPATVPDQVAASARAGRVSIVNGDMQKLPDDYKHDITPGYTDPISHFIVVAGYELSTDSYLVIDPASLHSDPASVVIHRFTAAELADFQQGELVFGRNPTAVITDTPAPV
ncbi:hypothetical protein GCM10011492_17290 [Flexivirga endophytica]|uniref:Peptidase C39-like domain-containing protein n=1 Tax=Flexivirga endophytica TaxID=1849103 RepID=A0A916T2M9_9MICO|nr:C39 family peptidase [Flexivirga endophytica]GGB27630.1 hypothetical protein GCM10011492_17290 [Flexivirga endophytica]GHB61482.1 hypothetical protein GCM10008112_32980 [Flexivirga endophytica]